MDKIIRAFSIYDQSSLTEQESPPVKEETDTHMEVERNTEENEDTRVQREEKQVQEEQKQDTTRPDTDTPETRPNMQQDRIIYVSRPRTPAQNKPVLKEIKGVTYYYRPGDDTPRVFNRYFSKEK